MMSKWQWALLVVAGISLGQSTRAVQEEAFKRWRQSATDVETRIVAEPSGNSILDQTALDQISKGAALYFAARQTYLLTQADQWENTSAGLPNVSGLGSLASGNPDMALAAAASTVNGSWNVIRNDPDPGLQNLRMALERERMTLASLTSVVRENQKGDKEIAESATRVAAARQRAATLSSEAAALYREGLRSNETLQTEWANYYRVLGEAARAPAIPATPVPVSPPSPAPAEVTPGPVAVEGPGAPRPVAPLFPLASRYVGTWIYPTAGEHYHGARPEAAQLVVREENGKLSGVFSAKFRPNIAGTKFDPLLEFQFRGDYQSARGQTLELLTSLGEKGQLTLNSVQAFNLLEVIFSIDGKTGTGKITQGNFFLIRK